MLRNFAKIFFLMAAFLMLPGFAKAAPNITSAPASISNGEVITVGGSGFGTKVNIAPKYFTNLESETIGAVPSGQITNAYQQGVTLGNKAHSGNNSLEWDYCADATAVAWASGTTYNADAMVTYNSNIYHVLNHVTSTIAPDLDSANFSFYAPYTMWNALPSYAQGQIIKTTGSTPWMICTAPTCGLISNSLAGWSPTLPGSHCPEGKGRQNDWQRNTIDLGAGGSDKVFITLWLYFDKGSSTCLNWQWKNIFITSNSTYYISLAPTESTLAYDSFYFDNNRWGNTAGPLLTYWDYTTIPAKSVTSLNLTAASDFYLFNQWQRIDLYAQRSSAGNVADGMVYFDRIGRAIPLTNRNDVVTHSEGDYPWRYIDLSNAIESVKDGYVDAKIYMDDIYVDTTQARVEICDSATWAARSHCEIQISQNVWNDTQIEFKVNQATFATNSSAYLYVVDPNGSVNASGYAINFVSADTTAPAAPTGLNVQ